MDRCKGLIVGLCLRSVLVVLIEVLHVRTHCLGVFLFAMLDPLESFHASINLLRFRKLQAAAHISGHCPANIDQLGRATYTLMAEGFREVYNPRAAYRGKDVSGASS